MARKMPRQSPSSQPTPSKKPRRSAVDNSPAIVKNEAVSHLNSLMVTPTRALHRSSFEFKEEEIPHSRDLFDRNNNEEFGAVPIHTPVTQSPGSAEFDNNMSENNASQSPVNDQTRQIGETPPFRQGTVTSGSPNVGDGNLELNKIINRISRAGADSLRSKIPRVVIVGDQSSGKSSCLEGLSEIKVPRDAGKCTSCPFEIQLEPSAEWFARVSIIKKYAYDPVQSSTRIRTPNKANAKNRIGPWLQQREESIDFDETKDPDKLQNILWWAHKSTMNPGQPAEDFANLAKAGHKHDSDEAKTADQEAFSPNVVQVYVTGPDQAPLSFVDLPGIINNPDDRSNQYLVDLVRKCMISYIMSQDCLVVITIAMTEDQANSTALRIVNEQGAENRAVGVLTKPDRTQSELQYIPIIKGKKFRLKHGYFVCRQPGNKEMSDTMDSSAARKLEEEYFKKTDQWPWKVKDDPIDGSTTLKDRFGTRKLKTELSNIFGQMNTRKIPEIHRFVDKELGTIERQLEKMPEFRTEEMLKKLEDLIREVSEDLKPSRGGLNLRYYGDATKFINNWKKTIFDAKFRKELSKYAPKLIVEFPPLVEEIRSSDEESPASSESHQGRARSTFNVETGEDELDEQRPARRRRISLTKFTIETIEDAEEKKQYPDIPGKVHENITPYLVQQRVLEWRQHLGSFFRATAEAYGGFLSEKITQRFSQVPDTPALEEAERIAKKLLDTKMERFKERVHFHFDVQSNAIRTLDKTSFELKKQKERANLLEKRLQHRKFLYFQKRCPFPAGNEAAWREKALKTKESDLDPDHSEMYIEVAAEVFATYSIIATHFCDFVHNYAHSLLFEEMQRSIGGELLKEFGIDRSVEFEQRNKAAIHLLTESPTRTAQRASLVAEQEKLSKTKKELDEYNNRYGRNQQAADRTRVVESEVESVEGGDPMDTT